MRLAILLLAFATVAGAEQIPAGRTWHDYARKLSDAGAFAEWGTRCVYVQGENAIVWRSNAILTFPTAADTDYSASPTNSLTWYADTMNERHATFRDVDPVLKAAILGLMDAVNAKLPATNRITANQLKQAVKARLP